VSLLMFQAAWDMTLCLYWCFRLSWIWHNVFIDISGYLGYDTVFIDVSGCLEYDTVPLLMFQTAWDITLCLYWCFRLPGIWHCVFTYVSDCLGYGTVSLLKFQIFCYMITCRYWKFQTGIWHCVFTDVSDFLWYNMTSLKFQTVWNMVLCL